MLGQYLNQTTYNNLQIYKDEKQDIFKCRFLQQGLVGYESNEKDGSMQIKQNNNLQNLEIVYIPEDHINDIANSFIGTPVIIGHQELNEEILKDQQVGKIEKVWIEDGWGYCKFSLDNKIAKNLISNGYSVSCSFYDEEIEEAGVHNNIPYNVKLIKVRPCHLAIVENPRFEGAKIYNNSIDNKVCINDSFMLKRFKRKNQMEKKEEEKKDNANEQEALSSFMERIEGKIDAIANMEKAESESMDNEMDDETKALYENEVDIDGEKMSVGDLVENYRKNKKDNTVEKDEDDVDEELQDDPNLKNNSEEKEEKEEEKKKSYNNNISKAFHRPRSNTENKPTYTSHASSKALAKILYGSK